MDSSLNMIDLQFFTPNKVYERVFNTERDSKNKSKQSSTKKEDFIFYRKRILQLIKDIVKGKKFTPEIHASFDEFTRNAIQHFMFLDKADIIQDSIGISQSKNQGKNGSVALPPIYESEEQRLANQLLYKEPVAPITRKMDDFVIKKNEVKRNTVIPKQKKYNIKHDKYKTKGVNSEKSIKKQKKNKVMKTKFKSKNKNKE